MPYYHCVVVKRISIAYYILNYANLCTTASRHVTPANQNCSIRGITKTLLIHPITTAISMTTTHDTPFVTMVTVIHQYLTSALQGLHKLYLFIYNVSLHSYLQRLCSVY